MTQPFAGAPLPRRRRGQANSGASEASSRGVLLARPKNLEEGKVMDVPAEERAVRSSFVLPTSTPGGGAGQVPSCASAREPPRVPPLSPASRLGLYIGRGYLCPFQPPPLPPLRGSRPNRAAEAPAPRAMFRLSLYGNRLLPGILSNSALRWLPTAALTDEAWA